MYLMYKILYVYYSVDCYVLGSRNCLRVSKGAQEFFVDAATWRYFYFSFVCLWGQLKNIQVVKIMLSNFKCRSAPHSLRCMLAVLLAGNRELFLFFFCFPLFFFLGGGVGVSCLCERNIQKLFDFLLLVPMDFEGGKMFLGSYACIYTSNGVSLNELAIFLSKDCKYTAKYNDDLCIVCWNGGNLLLCDGCPRSFHKGQI